MNEAAHLITESGIAALVQPQHRRNDGEQELLDFVGSLIIELARTHTRITQADIALWLAGVALGVRK